jgi:hypothetical protein
MRFIFESLRFRIIAASWNESSGKRGQVIRDEFTKNCTGQSCASIYDPKRASSIDKIAVPFDKHSIFEYTLVKKECWDLLKNIMTI